MSHDYVIRVLPQQHELEVELTVRGVRGELLVQTPTWVPGAYGLMKYGRDLSEVRAESRGRALPWRREGWSGYRIAEAEGEVTVRYRTYGYDPAWGELVGLVGHENAVLLATRYLYAPGVPGPCRVRYELPEGWRLHHPAGAKEVGRNTFEYPGYAALLDTPVCVGKFEVITRTVKGVPFHHLFLDRALGFDTEVEGFVDSLVRVAEAAHGVFGSFPFESYTYVFSFNPTAHWGLEHANSTMIGLGETALIDKDQRGRAVRVSAHELFHAWNVCRLKPDALARPDHGVGPVIDSLWIAEGVTRYYEFLLSVRAGEYTPEQFFSNVVNYYRHLEAMPGYARVSALDSSRTTFLNHNKYPGSINNTIDYYDKGMLIAFDLDAHLRTSGAGTLDADFRAFYDALVKSPTGFAHADVLERLGRAPGARELLAREIEQPAGLSTVARLEALGFEVKQEAVRYLGLVLEENTGPKIANVLDDSPAGQTGLAPGDEIARLDGFPYSFKALTWLIKRAKPVTLEVKRGHEVFRFELAPRERKQIAGLTWRGDATQLERLRTWLGKADYALSAGQSLSLASFENFHGIQSVI